MPHLKYMTRQGTKEHKVRGTKNGKKSTKENSKLRSGERSLSKNQNVTHNNIITANNVIINYSGDKPDGTNEDKQGTVSQMPQSVHF